MDWDEAKKRAKEVAADPGLTRSLVNQAFEKIQRHPGFLKHARKDLRLLLRMIKAQARGHYQIPWRSIVFGIAAIIYFLNPLDLIPDFIIGPGLLDDASILLMTFRSLRSDLDAYEQWEKDNSPR